MISEQKQINIFKTENNEDFINYIHYKVNVSSKRKNPIFYDQKLKFYEFLVHYSDKNRNTPFFT